jgi:hypothetical protein
VRVDDVLQKIVFGNRHQKRRRVKKIEQDVGCNVADSVEKKIRLSVGWNDCIAMDLLARGMRGTLDVGAGDLF